MARAAKATTTPAPSAPTRRSPLHDVLKPGRYGADHGGAPGVRLHLRHPLSIVSVIARKGKLRSLDAATKKHFGVNCPPPGHSASGRGIVLHWAGPEHWLAVAENRPEGALFGDLRRHLDGLASVSDQSHGRVVIVVSGPKARDLLAKGTPVDLHEREFAPGQCAMTQMAHVGVHIARTGPDTFELSLFRGLAESFWEWLTEMALEFGYELL